MSVESVERNARRQERNLQVLIGIVVTVGLLVIGVISNAAEEAIVSDGKAVVASIDTDGLGNAH